MQSEIQLKIENSGPTDGEMGVKEILSNTSHAVTAKTQLPDSAPVYQPQVLKVALDGDTLEMSSGPQNSLSIVIETTLKTEIFRNRIRNLRESNSTGLVTFS